MKSSRILISATVIAGLVVGVQVVGVQVAGAQQASAAENVELVLGSDKIKTKNKIFELGNGLAAAVALNAKGVAVFNYATKGSKDNLKRITAKKRAINLAIVSGKVLKKDKKRGKVLGLMTLGSTKKKPDWVVLVVRPKPPKGVSKKDYNNAIYRLVKALTGKKATKMLRKSWKRWAPQRNPIALKNIGVKVHPSAVKAFNEMGS